MLQILFLLLAATMFSCWMLGGLYAKYVTTANSADSARVAAFSVKDGNTMEKTYLLTPSANGGDSFAVEMENNSEVAIRYTFSIEKEGNLPLNITANGPAGTVLSKEENADCWTVEKKAGEGQNETYTFTLSIENTEESYQYAGGVEQIQLTVKAEQID